MSTMTLTNRTFRVIVTRREQLFIDLPARDEADALNHADIIWDRSETHRFKPILGQTPVEFEIDEEASMHFRDAANDDRADWALTALKAFARAAGTKIDAAGLHALICHLGHYADRNNIDFPAEIEDARAIWAEEKRQGGAS